MTSCLLIMQMFYNDNKNKKIMHNIPKLLVLRETYCLTSPRSQGYKNKICTIFTFTKFHIWMFYAYFIFTLTYNVTKATWRVLQSHPNLKIKLMRSKFSGKTLLMNWLFQIYLKTYMTYLRDDKIKRLLMNIAIF